MSVELKDIFLQLVRLGIGTSKSAKIPKDIDWIRLREIADEQGLSAIILDALNMDDTNLTDGMPQELKLEWIGEVLQDYEHRYAEYKNAIGSLSCFYNQHGFKMMVLKGYACSMNWPKPEHRPCGDIDIWQFGKQKEADEALAGNTDIRIDGSHHHHTVFEWDGFTVENHYDFVNVHHHKSSAKIEKILKELGKDDSHAVEVNGEIVYLPSENLHALFLIKHLVSHFASEHITLRQVWDWAFFVEKHGKNVDWPWLLDLLDEFHMREFFNCINAICVEELGFASTIFPYVQFNPILKDRVFKDIIQPEFSGEEPKSVFLRISFKYKRWKANQWKHELCYEESMWSAFWSGVWNHMLKPSSI